MLSCATLSSSVRMTLLDISNHKFLFTLWMQQFLFFCSDIDLMTPFSKQY